MGMGHGYHQISQAKESISTFQTHEGLHSFKVLVFGASPVTDLFLFNGLPGCTSIHDNIVVWGSTPGKHEENLDKCLTRLQGKGLTLRREKCTFGAIFVSWFPTVFSKSDMSADPRKIKPSRKQVPRQNNDDVNNFLQAYHFNPRFTFDKQVPMQSLLNRYAT